VPSEPGKKVASLPLSLFLALSISPPVFVILQFPQKHQSTNRYKAPKHQSLTIPWGAQAASARKKAALSPEEHQERMVQLLRDQRQQQKAQHKHQPLLAALQNQQRGGTDRAAATFTAQVDVSPPRDRSPSPPRSVYLGGQRARVGRERGRAGGAGLAGASLGEPAPELSITVRALSVSLSVSCSVFGSLCVSLSLTLSLHLCFFPYTRSCGQDAFPVLYVS